MRRLVHHSSRFPWSLWCTFALPPACVVSALNQKIKKIECVNKTHRSCNRAFVRTSYPNAPAHPAEWVVKHVVKPSVREHDQIQNAYKKRNQNRRNTHGTGRVCWMIGHTNGLKRSLNICCALQLGCIWAKSREYKAKLTASKTSIPVLNSAHVTLMPESLLQNPDTNSSARIYKSALWNQGHTFQHKHKCSPLEGQLITSGFPKPFCWVQESEVLRHAQFQRENIYQGYRCTRPASELSGELMVSETSMKWAVLAWHSLQILLYIYAHYKTYGKARHDLNNLKDRAQNVQRNVHRGVVCWMERFSVP